MVFGDIRHIVLLLLLLAVIISGAKADKKKSQPKRDKTMKDEAKAKIVENIIKDIEIQLDHFEHQRRQWRTPQTNPEGSPSHTRIERISKMSIEAVDDIFVDYRDRQPFPRRIRLDDMVEFLKVYWPEMDRDYPTPERLAAMGMGELVEGEVPFYVDVPFELFGDDGDFGDSGDGESQRDESRVESQGEHTREDPIPEHKDI